MKKKNLHGYMTIEAALLMPLIWFIMLFTIFCGFFQYDRCIGEQDCKIVLLRASNMKEKSETEIRQKVLEKGELAGKRKLLFSDSVERELHVMDKKAEMAIKGTVKTVLHNLINDAGKENFTYGAVYEADRYDPVGFIRTCRRLKKYAGS